MGPLAPLVVNTFPANVHTGKGKPVVQDGKVKRRTTLRAAKIQARKYRAVVSSLCFLLYQRNNKLSAMATQFGALVEKDGELCKQVVKRAYEGWGFGLPYPKLKLVRVLVGANAAEFLGAIKHSIGSMPISHSNGGPRHLLSSFAGLTGSPGSVIVTASPSATSVFTAATTTTLATTTPTTFATATASVLTDHLSILRGHEDIIHSQGPQLGELLNSVKGISNFLSSQINHNE